MAMGTRFLGRIPRVRCALVIIASTVACDLGVTPPADVPVLAISARNVVLFAPRTSSTPDMDTVRVSNNGSGSLAGWTVSAPVYLEGEPGWLDVEPGDSTIVLIASAENLPRVDRYTAMVSVVLESASNSPRTIMVTFDVGKTQQIELATDSLTFGALQTGARPPPQTVAVRNGGDGTLSELLVESIDYKEAVRDWLDTSLGSTVAPTQLELAPDTTDYPPGTYHATVFVFSRIADPNRDSVEVEFIVAESPQLVLAATRLALDAVEGDAAIERHVRLFEKKGRPLSGLTAEPQPGTHPWLAATLDSAGAPTTLTIAANPASPTLSAPRGDTTYVDTVTVASATGNPQQVEVALRLRRGATVHASMDTVRFTAYRTGPVPGPQVVRIENDGAGILSGLDAVAPPWLQTPVFSGDTAPADLTLEVNPAQLNTASTNLLVTGTGAYEDTVRVELTVLPGPRVVLSSNRVTFRADSGQLDMPDAVVVALANGGEGSLTDLGLTVSDTAWLNAVLVGPQAAPAELRLQPATTDTALGTYTADVTVTSAVPGVTPATVTVEYQVDPSPTGPPDTIAVSSSSVRFVRVSTDAQQPTAVLAVEYSGSQATPTVSPNNAWLTADLEGDTLLTLAVDATGLNPGAYPGTVTLREQGGGGAPETFSLPVDLTVLKPLMVATAPRIMFRAYQGQSTPVGSRVVTVSNGSSGVLSAVTADPQSVKGLFSAQALPPTDAMTPIVIQPLTTNVLPSTYLDTVLIRSPVAANDPLELEVVFEVDAGPTIAASPEELTLVGIAGDTTPVIDSVLVLNAGRGPLDVLNPPVPDPASPWLSAQLDSATSPPKVVIQANSSGLSVTPGPGSVTITSDQAANVIPVQVAFEVVPPPRIQISPTTLVFQAIAGDGAPPDSQVISVFDPVGRPTGELTVSVQDGDWLRADTASATIVVRPDTVLPASDTAYAATLTISSSLDPNRVVEAGIRYHVDLGRTPVIVLEPDSLTFERPNPPAQTVNIENGGSGTLRELRVREVSGADWLFVLLDNRIAPATLTVAVNPETAADEPANAVAQLEISGERAQPRFIWVTLR